MINVPLTVRIAFAALVALALGATLPAARAGTGMTTLTPLGDDHPVTVFYPTTQADQPERIGPFTLALARNAAPRRGNGRLIVLSHGSGGSAFVHADLARALVDAGFVVAAPQHRGDSTGDDGTPGPQSWKRRPGEVSRAIDAIARDPRFAALLGLARVGVYGMSAGGHTALSMAGGAWSPGNFKRHCEAHIADDFYTCVGLALRQTGGMLDGLKRTLALSVIRHQFDDDTPQVHHDTRVAAVVAAVPLAADFDLATLAEPRVPLGLATAGRDAWLVPRFHSDRVLEACRRCERVVEVPQAGHGAYLSPSPPGLSGLVGDLLNDPPGFDRSTMAQADRRITAFFTRHLVAADAP